MAKGRVHPRFSLHCDDLIRRLTCAMLDHLLAALEPRIEPWNRGGSSTGSHA